MPYINKFITTANGEKAYEILLSNGFDMRLAQRLIDRGRLACDGAVVNEKNAKLRGQVTLIEYQNSPKGLKPIYEFEDFAVFDKPSGVLSHPNGRHCDYSLSDEIWYLFGREACVAHRLDRETSGLIIVAKNFKTQVELKSIFENRAVKKSYLALVNGDIRDIFKSDVGKNCIKYLDENFNVLSKIKLDKGVLKFCIDAKMNLANDYDDIKTRMCIDKNGKNAITQFEFIRYFDDINASLVRCFPITGRQHQIRLHLFHVQHRILGDPLYGLNREQIIKILDCEMSENERKEATGSTRLLLHADEINFIFRGKEYHFKSHFDATNKFYQLAKN